ncbi:MAG: NAD(P)-dependent alcohol dehydrogenase [Tardiphaga sp.]|jgi:NADPH:quinone reductase-like Zn-dependent oxidoreductase|nr:NAD(P)-dependent alcohol dehydrogenase [Tardiphaga sp.]MDB5573462.1 NAD(P)-dependent alcohol dehydrogenase [Tardiphaga sp.]
MWAWSIKELGDPPRVAIVERERPAPKPGDVVVRLTAASLNYRDLELGRRGAGRPLDAPFTPLSDGCGVVEAVGDGVTTWKIGDRVCSTFFPNWTAGDVDHLSRGIVLGMPGFEGIGQEFFVLPERALIAPPAFLTDEEAATLTCAGVTAWRAVNEVARLRPGATVLLQGTGGVSIFALQFAKAAGLRTIITSSSDEKLAKARAIGADETINYRSTPKWATEARKLTDGRGVDLVVEVGGADTLQQSLRAVRVGGAIAVIGILSGRQQEIDVTSIFSANVTISGISVGSHAMFAAMNRAIETHRIRPLVSATFARTDISDAYAAMAAAGHMGKLVITAR